MGDRTDGDPTTVSPHPYEHLIGEVEIHIARIPEGCHMVILSALVAQWRERCTPNA